MQLKVGIDLVNLPRFKSKISKNTLNLTQIFSPAELKTSDFEHLAGILAAKEATIKALGLTPGSWLQLEVHQTKNSRPQLRLTSEIDKRIENVDLSIAHDQNYAIAVVVVTFK